MIKNFKPFYVVAFLTVYLSAQTSEAQDLHFSQYFNAPLLTNPANTGFEPDADWRAGINYRDQWAGILNNPYKTMSAWADAQIFNDRFETGWMGIGTVILKDVAGLTPEELAGIFEEWNRGELDSYLIQITSQIFRKIDPETGKPIVDVILDKAGQKGTGLWTLQSALSQSVVISTINAAVEARVISSRKQERVEASKILPQPKVTKFTGNRADLVTAVRDALYASKIISYAQGMELLGAASVGSHWDLNFGDIATIWRGGCIIRAKFLNRIREAYERNPKLHNLLLDQYFTGIIERTQDNWRVAVATAVKQGVAVPAFSASLAYFDSYRSARLPSNLLQAQRDFFGAHTYERVDRPGVFHTEWLEPTKEPSEKAAKPKAPQRAGE